MRRSAANPVLTRLDIPDVPPAVTDVSSVFNPGATAWGDGPDGVLLLLRVQTRGRETVWMTAESPDGVTFEVRPRVVEIEGLADVPETVFHAYDPRITRVEDTYYVVFAVDTDGGCRLATARTHDFERLELVSFETGRDLRNGVLFPALGEGRWLRLERPNRPVEEEGPLSGDEIVLAASADLRSFEEVGPVMQGRWHYWDERIGSGPPPVRVAEGWLHLYHGVAHHFGGVIYQMGVVLLDADDPTRVLARTTRNVLEPRELYETVGQVPNVVFASGWVVDGVTSDEVAAPDARVRVYYGAADTCIGLAETTVAELLRSCRED